MVIVMPFSPSPPASSPPRPLVSVGRNASLKSKDLTQLGWTGIGQNRTTDIDRWDHAIAAVPLLDA